MATTITSTIKFPYKRSLGPVLGPFMTALTEKKILGIRAGDRVLCPPMEWDPDTAKSTDPADLIEVGPAGTVRSWTWVMKPSEQHPVQRPFAFALVQLDGADTTMMHAVDAGSIDAMSTGMRVAPRWRGQRVGHITDLEAFVPGEDPQVSGDDAGPADEAVTMMDYNASITYTNPVSPQQLHFAEGTAHERLIGSKCPTCERIYTMGRPYCPVDALPLTPEHDVDLPKTGVISNYTIVTPIQYPGQTETEPFARCMIKLDGVAVVLGYQEVLDTPASDIRVGMHVGAVFASEAERAEGLRGDARSLDGYLVGWMPTGEPDAPVADLLDKVL